MKTNLRKLTAAGILIALGVVLSPLNIPIGASKCFPVQHFINVLAAVVLGPFWGVGMAFVTSLLRVFLGMGTLLAFPGSMIGALCAGLAYRYIRVIPAAFLGEIIGTGVLGALAAYPVAAFILGKASAVFAYVIPFSISTIAGALLAAVFLAALKRTKAWAEIEKFMQEPHLPRKEQNS